MKAAVRRDYGLADAIHLVEADQPVPKDNEVLVQVRATSLNSSDWEFLTGKPVYVRAWGLFQPRYPILGSDIAGRVVAVGKEASKFRVGDEVFGDVMGSWGGFAEYVCAPESALLHKPTSMTFEQACALPQSSLVALQGLRDKGLLQAGQRVLINGAGGGAGTFAVQIAKLLGAEVTGVDSARKLDTLLSLGADHVIDYAREDFCHSGRRYDLILDLVAQRSIFETRRALSPRGRYVLAGGSLSRILQVVTVGALLSIGRKKLGLLTVQPNRDLGYVVDLFEAGSLSPVIDCTYPLCDVGAALRYLGEGQARGKVVIAQ